MPISLEKTVLENAWQPKIPTSPETFFELIIIIIFELRNNT